MASPKTPKKLSLADLTEVERDVIVALTGRKSVASAVTLASELWTKETRWGGADPVGFADYLVRELCERGLLTYRLSSRGAVRTPYSNLPETIRLTPEGWRLAGYPLLHAQAFTRLARTIPDGHMGDRTNFRHHHEVAVGVGPIEVDTFAEHRVRFPHHIHMYPEGATKLSTTTEPAIEKKRGYVKVTQEMETQILAMRQRMGDTASYADVASECNLPERTVKYVLVDLPRLRRLHDGDAKAAASLKSRVFEAIEGLGEVNDVAELKRVLGQADDDHNIVHVLHSLRKQGRIDFEDRGNGRANQPVNIRVHKSKRVSPELQRAVNPPETEVSKQSIPPIPPEVKPFVAQAVADAELDAVEGVHTVKPSAVGYPIFDALLEREANRIDRDAKAMAYVEAAEAIEKVDPDMAKTLMQKADGLNVAYPSPLEAEYLRHVADAQLVFKAGGDIAKLRDQLERLRDHGFQPKYNGRPSCPFCLNFVDNEQTHVKGCILVKALAD